MIMGNYLRGTGVLRISMATKQTVGMWHPTVVPENFEREETENGSDDGEDGDGALTDR